MKNAQHTPGPWLVTDENLPHGPKPTLITYLGVPIGKALDNCDSVEETYANARLIAAAPELLDALEEMEPAFNNLIDNMAQQDKATDDTIALMTVYIKASQKARAAIAKAKGE